jgi:hypothetical protein
MTDHSAKGGGANQPPSAPALTIADLSDAMPPNNQLPDTEIPTPGFYYRTISRQRDPAHHTPPENLAEKSNGRDLFPNGPRQRDANANAAYSAIHRANSAKSPAPLDISKRQYPMRSDRTDSHSPTL